MPEVPVEGEEVELGEEAPAEETHDGFVSDKQHAERIGVQHKRFRDEERKATAAVERATAAEKERDELRAKAAEVIIPPVPDKHSDTFDVDIAARDEAIQKQASNTAEQNRLADDRTKEDEARAARDKDAIDKNIAVFDANMVTHGLNPAATKVAAEAVIEFGISDTFQDILLEDPDGPLFVTYLAQNPIELESMNAMTPLQLVNHLNGDLRAKASLLKPQTSNAPDPPITPSGGGAPEQKEDWEKGAVYS